MKNSHKTIVITLIFQLLFGAFIIERGVGAISSGVVTSLFGGVGGSIPYQSAANTTAFLANGSAGQVLTSAGTTLPPVWATGSGGVTGSGTAGICTRWAAGSPSTTLENSRAVCTDTLFQVNIGSGIGGRVLMGDITPANNHVFIDANDSSNQIRLATNDNPGITGGTIKIDSGAGSTTIGDAVPVQKGTTVSVVDATRTIGLNGDNITLSRTITATGTTGAQTINKAAGTVNLAAGTAAAVVTNSFANVNSLIFIQPQTLDATCRNWIVTAKGSGMFTITATAVCTGETPVAFWVTN